MSGCVKFIFGVMVMEKRKYPMSIFIMGVVVCLFRTWYILAITIFIYFVSLFHPDTSTRIALIPLIVWIFLAIIKQLIYRKTLLSMNPDDDLFNKMFADNDKGYKNVTQAVDEIISKLNNKPNM
jgi:hypothetical protein